ncbi:hypothetical protein ACO1O0_003073 [Amphichorda felina]
MKSLIPIFLLAATAAAKTDIEGCTSFTSMVTVRPEPGYGNTYQTVIWYLPDSLEICQGVDCGGGRAPPKTVPGCPMYSGTETVTPSFLKEDPMKATPTVGTAEATATDSSSEASLTSEPHSTAESTSDEPKPTVSSSTTKNESEETAKTTVTSPSGSAATATTGREVESSGDAEKTTGGAEVTTTDIPDAAVHTGVAALNVVAGIAAAVALM